MRHGCEAYYDREKTKYGIKKHNIRVKNIVFQNIVRFVVLFLFQMIVLNNITLSSLIVPNICVLFILMLPTNMSRIPLLLVSFATGLLLDITTNMLGFQTFAFTMLGMARLLIGDRILLRNEPIVIARPSIHAPNFQLFSIYSLILLLVFYISYILVESFSFHNIWHLLFSILLNVLITWIIIILYQAFFVREEQQ